MAKEKLDDFESSGELWNDEEFDFEPDFGSVKDDRNPNTKMLHTGARAVKDTVLSRQFAGKFLREALPEEFSKTADGLDNTLWEINKIKDNVIKKARPAVLAAKQTARTLNRLIPNPLQDKIEKALAANSTSGSTTKVDVEGMAVESGLAGIFEEVNNQQDEKIEKLADKITENDFRQKLFETLGKINSGIQRDYALKTQVTRRFQQKQLELQIRQLVVSRNLLEVTTRSAQENAVMLKAIMKNTGLPDIMKEHNSESFKRLAREKLMGKAQEHLGGYGRRYFGKVGKNVDQWLTDRIDKFMMGIQGTNDALEALETTTKMSEELGVNKKDFMTEMLAGQGTMVAGAKLGQWLRKKNPFNGKLKNVFGRTKYQMDNISHLLNDWAEKNQEFGTLKGTAAQLLNVRESQGGTVYTGKNKILSDELNREDRKLRALEVIIPGMLSRLIQATVEGFTGKKQELTVFDEQTGRFGNFSSSVKNIKDSLISRDTVKHSNDQIMELVNKLDSKTNLSAKDRSALFSHLSKMSRSTKAFSVENILKGDVGGMSKAGQMKLRKNINTRYGITEVKGVDNRTRWQKIKDGYTAENGHNIGEDATIFNSARNAHEGLLNRVHGLANSGQLEQLIEMGVVKKDGNDWILDEDFQTRFNDELRLEDETKERDEAIKRAESYRNKKRKKKGKPNKKDAKNKVDIIRRINSLTDMFARNSNPDDINKIRNHGGFGGAGSSVMNGEELKSAIELQTEQLLAGMKESQGQEELRQILEQVALVNEQIAAGITYIPGEGSRPGQRRGLLSRIGSGLKWSGKKGWQLGKTTAMAPWNAAKRAWRVSKWMARKPGRWIKNKLFGAKDKVNVWLTDAYVRGTNGLRHAIEAAGLTEGRYLDVNTGKIIKSLKDITGSVMDQVSGKLVITDEEFKNGLLNSFGEKIKLKGFFNAIKNAGGNLFNLVTSPVTFAKNTAKKIFNSTKNLILSPPDIYVGGEDKPRLLSTYFKNGMYFSGMTGKPLRYFGDIDGDVVIFDSTTRERKVVLTALEIQEKGLYDSAGRPIRGMLSKIKNALSSMWDKTKKVASFLNPFKAARWAKDKTMAVLRGGKNLLSRAASKAPLGQSHWLKKIYKLLVNKFTGGDITDVVTGDDEDLGIKVKSRWHQLKERFKRQPKEGDSSTSRFKTMREVLNDRKERMKAKLEDLEITDKAKELYERKKRTVGDRAKNIKESLLGREGSWMNRMSKKIGGSAAVKGVKGNIEKHGFWKGMLLSAVMAIPAAVGMVWKKVTSAVFGLKDLIKNAFTWFMRKKAIDTAMGGGGDGGNWGGDGDYDRRRNRNRQGRGNNRNRGRGGTRRPTPRIRPSSGRPPLPRPGGRPSRGNLLRRMGNGIKNVFTRGGGRAAGEVGRRSLVRAGLRGVASTIGRRALITGAAHLGRMALTMAGPVGWGILAGAALIYGGYKLFKFIQNTPDDFQHLRLLMYGFDGNDRDINEKILNVENIVYKTTTFKEGKVDPGKIDFKAIVSAMEIDMSQAAKRNAFARWFDQRFMPTYTSIVKAAKTLVPSANVTDIKGTIPDHYKGPWAEKSKIPGDGSDGTPHPYFFSVSPFGEGNLVVGTAFIDKRIAVIVKKYKKEADKFAKNQSDLEESYKKVAEKIGGPVYNPYANRKNKTADEKIMSTFVTTTERDTAMQSITGSPAEKAAWAKDMTVDDILAVRMRMYGLPTLDVMQVRVIMELEKEVMKNVTYNSNNTVTMNKSTKDVFELMGVRFGISDIDVTMKMKWTIWYEGRFIPIFLNYLAQVKLENKNINPLDAWKFLKAEQLVRLVEFMNKAVAKDPNGKEISVWKVTYSPFFGVELNTDPGVIADSLKRLKDAVKSEELKEKTRTVTKTDANGNIQKQKVNQAASLFKNLLQEKGFVQNNYSKSEGLGGAGTSFENAGTNNIRAAPKGQMNLTGNAAGYAQALLNYARANGIDGEELAMFMGQLAEETGDFTTMTEMGNADYFTKYEKGNLAKQLGNTQVGDGARFKGRGWMQITGRALYEKFSKLLGYDFTKDPEKMADPKVANYTAVWFWKKYALPLIKRKGLPANILTTSAAINGWYEDKNNPGWPRKAINYDTRVEKIRQWAQKLGLTNTDLTGDTGTNNSGGPNQQNPVGGVDMETSGNEAPGSGGLSMNISENSGGGGMTNTPTMSNQSTQGSSGPSRPLSPNNPLAPNQGGGTTLPSRSSYNPLDQDTGGLNKVEQNWQRTQNSMNTASVANGNMTENYQGLKVKPKVATNGGPVVPGLIRLAEEIQLRVEDFFRFTALNDAYHQKLSYNSSHKRGLALDFTLTNDVPKWTVQAFRTVLNIMAIGGMGEPTIIKDGGHWMSNGNFIVINEYLRPTGASTGGHIHVNFTSPAAAAQFLKNMGPKAGSVGDEDDGESAAPGPQTPDASAGVVTTPNKPPITSNGMESTPNIPSNSPNALPPDQQARVESQKQQAAINQMGREQQQQAERTSAANAAANQVTSNNDVAELNRQMLQVQRDMLTELQEIKKSLLKGDSNPTTQSKPQDSGQSYVARGTNNGNPMPVNLKVG